jgi:hypothetical protein
MRSGWDLLEHGGQEAVSNSIYTAAGRNTMQKIHGPEADGGRRQVLRQSKGLVEDFPAAASKEGFGRHPEPT